MLAAYRESDEPILIEATCNQVNQDGGYTGMTPAAFRRFVEGLAREAGVDPRRSFSAAIISAPIRGRGARCARRWRGRATW